MPYPVITLYEGSEGIPIVVERGEPGEGYYEFDANGAVYRLTEAQYSRLLDVLNEARGADRSLYEFREDHATYVLNHEDRQAIGES